MKCPICGAEIQDDALFCTNCGQKLPQQAAAPAEETVTVSGEPYEALLAKVKTFLDDRRSELQKALQDNKTLTADKKDLDDQISSIRSDNMDLAGKMADLEKQLKDKDKLLAETQAELDKARQTIARQEQEKYELKDKLEQGAAAPVAEEAAPEAPADEPAPEVPAADIEVPENEADLIDEPTEQIADIPENTEPAPAAEPAAYANQICPSCGSVMPPENKFCTNCGTALK